MKYNSKCMIGVFFATVLFTILIILFMVSHKGPPSENVSELYTTDGSNKYESAKDNRTELYSKEMVKKESKPSEENQTVADVKVDSKVHSPTDPLLSELELPSIEMIQIDSLRNTYLETSHQIRELPPPAEPILLQRRYPTKNSLKPEIEKLVCISDLPNGRSVGTLYRNTAQLLHIDPNGHFAEYSGKMVVELAVIGDATNSKPIPQSYDKTINEKYKIYVDNHKEGTLDASGNINERRFAISSKPFNKSIFRFPLVPIEVGKRYELKTPMSESLVGQVEEDGINTTVEVKRRVEFDGREAYELFSHQIQYSGNGEDAEYILSDIKAKYYVDAETGRILWREHKREILDSSMPNCIGIVITERGQLIEYGKSNIDGK